MNVNDAFPSRYIKAADLADAAVVVTIRAVEMEDIGQGQKKERKPVVYFEGKQKGLVLNKTNANMIQKIAGSPDTDDWAGVKIRLVAAEVEFQGDSVQAVRVRQMATSKPMAKPMQQDDDSVAPVNDDDIPF
jgi:hypothetical protein